MLEKFKKAIEFYNLKVWEEVVQSFLSNSFSSVNLDQIFNDYWYKKIEKKLLILNEIYIIWNSYEKIINKEDFLSFLSNKIEKIDVHNLKNETYYKIIYELFLNDNNIFLKLRDNYKINFWWTFKSYKINLSNHNNDIDSFIDDFNDKIKVINNEYRKKSKTNPIILPYNSDWINDYYIIHYWFDKNNKSLDDLFTNDQKIKSSNSFYFFFYVNEELKTLHIIFRQAFHIVQLDILKKSIDSVLWPVCWYEPDHIIDFSWLDSKLLLPSVDAIIDVLKINSSSIDFNNITIEWEKSLKYYQDLVNENKSSFSIKELKILIKKYKWKELDYSLNWEVHNNSIKLEWKTLSIRKFINYLNWLWLFINNKSIDSAVNYNLSDLFLEAIFVKNNKIKLNNIHLSNIDLIKPFIQKNTYEYCWKIIQEKISSNINENEIDFNSGKIKVKIWNDNKVDELKNNILLWIKSKELLAEKIKKSFEFKKINNIYIIEFSNQWKWQYKNVKVIFSNSLWDLTSYLIWKSNKEIKYLTFLNENIENSKKIDLLNNYQCLTYDINYFEQFYHNNEKFIIDESSKIINKKDIENKFRNIPKRWDWENEINIFKIALSWNWDLFEEYVSKILFFFFPVFISLWNHLRWKSVPDGLMINNHENSLFMYDAKSSDNIRTYVNKEVRKFADYITTLFPQTTENNNYFFIIWPSSTKTIENLNKEKIEWLSENIIWKDLIEQKNEKLFIYELIY